LQEAEAFADQMRAIDANWSHSTPPLGDVINCILDAE